MLFTGKTYYYMAKALDCLLKFSPEMPHERLRTRNVLEYVLNSAIEALKRLGSGGERHGVPIAAQMVGEMEICLAEVKQNPPPPLVPADEAEADSPPDTDAPEPAWSGCVSV